jgi:hypothetical protein
MLRKLSLAAAAFVTLAVGSAAPTVPATAQGAFAPDRYTCLRNNRIWSWNVVDPRTMVVTDRGRNRYMVHLSGGCFGLDNSSMRIGFRTATNLGCLQRGDRVSYRDFALNRIESCFVNAVEPLGPGPRYGDDGYSSAGDRAGPAFDPYNMRRYDPNRQ